MRKAQFNFADLSSPLTVLPNLGILSFVLILATSLPAQDTEKEKLRAITIDDQALLSSRAIAMGGALSTLADDVDAVILNPAGIGGLSQSKEKLPFVRKLYFPWSAMSINDNSQALYGDFRHQGGAGDSQIGKAIIDAHAGKHQYARASVLSGLVMGRTIVVPFADQQVGAISRGGDSGVVDARYRSQSGLAYGLSATDSQERLFIGYSGTTMSRSETSGAFNYLDIVDKERRKAVLKDMTKKTSATAHNFGVTWIMGKKARPALSLVVKNAGNTVYRASKGDGDEQVNQDVTLAVSSSPQLGKSVIWNFIFEGQHLSDESVLARRKYHLGTEVQFGGFGSYAWFSLRAGYQDAGPAFGAALNLGLINFEAAQQSVDVGVGGNKLVEQRITGTAFVNVASF